MQIKGKMSINLIAYALHFIKDCCYVTMRLIPVLFRKSVRLSHCIIRPIAQPCVITATLALLHTKIWSKNRSVGMFPEKKLNKYSYCMSPIR